MYGVEVGQLRMPDAKAPRARLIRGWLSRLSASILICSVKTFSVYRRIKGGSPERVTLGRYPEMSIEQARRKSAEVNAAIEFGANPAEVKRAHKGELTFGDLFKEYLGRHAKTHKRTWEDDEQRYQQYLQKPLGSKNCPASPGKALP
jgi:hypothetical protein